MPERRPFDSGRAPAVHRECGRPEVRGCRGLQAAEAQAGPVPAERRQADLPETRHHRSDSVPRHDGRLRGRSGRRHQADLRSVVSKHHLHLLISPPLERTMNIARTERENIVVVENETRASLFF